MALLLSVIEHEPENKLPTTTCTFVFTISIIVTCKFILSFVCLKDFCLLGFCFKQKAEAISPNAYGQL